jgi:hypothetical protein
MIKFIQQQATLRFDVEPIVISAIVEDRVHATVRLTCIDPNAIINVGILPPGVPILQTTQAAPSPASLRVSFQLPG